MTDYNTSQESEFSFMSLEESETKLQNKKNFSKFERIVKQRNSDAEFTKEWILNNERMKIKLNNEAIDFIIGNTEKTNPEKVSTEPIKKKLNEEYDSEGCNVSIEFNNFDQDKKQCINKNLENNDTELKTIKEIISKRDKKSIIKNGKAHSTLKKRNRKYSFSLKGNKISSISEKSPLIERIEFTRKLKMNELRNKLEETNIQMDSLKQEIRDLKIQLKLETRNNVKRDNQVNKLPILYNRLLEDVQNLQNLVKKQKKEILNSKNGNKTLQIENDKLKNQVVKFEILNKEHNLQERHNLKIKNKQLEGIINKNNEEIKNLKVYGKNLVKNNEYNMMKMKNKSKKSDKIIEEMTERIKELEKDTFMKSKILNRYNIYSQAKSNISSPLQRTQSQNFLYQMDKDCYYNCEYEDAENTACCPEENVLNNCVENGEIQEHTLPVQDQDTSKVTPLEEEWKNWQKNIVDSDKEESTKSSIPISNSTNETVKNKLKEADQAFAKLLAEENIKYNSTKNEFVNLETKICVKNDIIVDNNEKYTNLKFGGYQPTIVLNNKNSCSEKVTKNDTNTEKLKDKNWNPNGKLHLQSSFEKLEDEIENIIIA
ncbi:hypothetical protein A3Q56_01958 [Intoshia linei]|uniref:Lebercilin domain-containing protein n=1 Tax=Intoshia linei TaxID=1819745 RepID=A0A177B9U6_9BILA|nr:hypothetical protein A3Q56_01958 [Intoshia linei]